eukprot:1159015-Pelagomonas_calceolata.AAC.4
MRWFGWSDTRGWASNSGVQARPPTKLRPQRTQNEAADGPFTAAHTTHPCSESAAALGPVQRLLCPPTGDLGFESRTAGQKRGAPQAKQLSKAAGWE